MVTTTINLLPQLISCNRKVQRTYNATKKLVRSFQYLYRSQQLNLCKLKLLSIKTLFFAMPCCTRKCQTFRKKFMAFQRQLKLVDKCQNLEFTPALQKKITKKKTRMMAEKYFSSYICNKC